MPPTTPRAAAIAALGLALMFAAAPAHAGGLLHRMTHKDGDINHFGHVEPGVDKAASAAYYADHTHCRAGYPLDIADHAYQTKSPYEIGYFVGGGTAFHGSERGCTTVGTWGFDYDGHILPVGNRLKWSFGRRYQGGSGRYDSDGKHEVPDVFATDYHYLLHGDEE